MSEDNNRPAETNDLLKKMRAITADLWGNRRMWRRNRNRRLKSLPGSL